MIVRNEEKYLRDCLNSIRGFADEIIVVDTGSEDGTIKIAEDLGAKVIHSDWRNDFSYSRNISLEHATSRWILWLDADDRIPATETEKVKAFKTGPPNRAFYFKIRNVRPGGFGPQWFQLRMFANHPKIRFERKVHEQVSFAIRKLGFPQIKTDIRIDHVGYEDPALGRRKALRNRTILLSDLPRYQDDPAYVSALGDSFFISEEFAEAIVWYEKVLKIPGGIDKQGDIYRQIPISIALSYQNLGDFENAMRWLEKSLEKNPDKIDSLFLAAKIKEKTGNFAEAIDYYERVTRASQVLNTYAIDSEGLRARAFVCLGKLNDQMGRADRAEEAYRKCLDQFPKVLNGYSELWTLLIRKKQFQEAAEIFQRYLKIFPMGDPKVCLGYAKALVHSGNFDEANRVLAGLKKLIPGIGGAEKNTLNEPLPS